MPDEILVIEDDPDIARSLQQGLIQHSFTVVLCSTGEDGIAVAQRRDPRLILLDVRLPDSSGFDVCRRLRQLGLRQPILMLTVQREEVDKVLGLELGADDYITKPFGLRELISRIRSHLRRAYGELSAAGGDRLYVADLVIDRHSASVRRGDEVLTLTPTEFRLLVYLAQHVGQALTRAQLLQGVWGYDAEIEDERTVNVHVRRLREKVEIDPSQPRLILTVPGVGYRLNDR